MAGLIHNMTMPNQYTPVSFGRLLAVAGRQLRLKTAHFQAALFAIINGSGLILAPNLMQEQVSCAFMLTTNGGYFPTVKRRVLLRNEYKRHQCCTSRLLLTDVSLVKICVLP